MKNMKTYEQYALNEELFKKKEDDAFGQKLLDYIVNHCDDIDLRIKGNSYKFNINSNNRNEKDPLGEEEYEETDVKVEFYHHGEWLFGDILSIDGEEINLSRGMKHKIYKALKNIEQLKKNKIKKHKMDKTEELLKKLN